MKELTTSKKIDPMILLENTGTQTFGTLAKAVEDVFIKHTAIPFLEKALNYSKKKQVVCEETFVFIVPVDDEYMPDISRIDHSKSEITKFAINQLIYISSFITTSKLILKFKNIENDDYTVSGYAYPELFLEFKEISDFLDNTIKLLSPDIIKEIQEKFCSSPYYDFNFNNNQDEIVKSRLQYIFYPIFYLEDKKECLVKIKIIFQSQPERNSLQIEEIQALYNYMIQDLEAVSRINTLNDYTENVIKQMETEENLNKILGDVKEFFLKSVENPLSKGLMKSYSLPSVGEVSFNLKQETAFEINKNIMPPDTLTPKEKEVFNFIMKAISNKQIAEKLIIAESTVEKHINSILRKTECADSKELIVKYRS